MSSKFENELSPHLMDILRAMGDGTVITDANMIITFFNKAAEDIFGYAAEEVVGQNLNMLLPSNVRAGHDALVQGFVDSSDVRRPMKGRRVKGLRKDGKEFYAEAAISKIKTNNGYIFTAAVRDVTELTHANERLHERNFMLNSISNAQKAMIENKTPHDVFNAILDDVLSFTGSEYGFIGHVYYKSDNQPYLKTTAITDISWNEESRVFYEESATEGLEFHNLESLFGAALKSKQLVVANDVANDPRARGVPHGHPALRTFLAVPIMSGSVMVGLLGVANREGGYKDNLVERLMPYVTTMATVFESYQERALLEESDRLNTRMMRILDESINETFIVALDTMKFVMVNQRALDNLGYSLDEAMSMSPMDMNPAFTMAGLMATIMPVISGQVDYVVANKVIYRKDGTSYDAEIYYRVFDADEPPVLIGSMIDRTEQNKAAAELQKSQKSLAEAQHIARIGNWEWNLAADSLTISDVLYDMFNLDRSVKNLPGKALAHLIAPDVMMEAVEGINNVIRRRRPNYSAIHKIISGTSREMWCHGVAEPIINAEGRVTGLKGTIQDVTDRVDMEHQLRQAQKMEAVGQLTGGLAHDFNNLLAVVLGTLDLLKDEVGDNPLMMSYIENSRKAATRGAELTQRLLAFSRKQSLKPKLVKINDMVKGMYTLLRSSVGDSISFDFEPTPAADTVRVDIAQMESAILNLAINARDAMPEGGKITITTSHVTLTDKDIDEDSSAKAGDFIRIDFADTGTGMSAETLARAFDPFYTTKGVGAGSGLGLSMVYGFMMQSGGLAHLASVEGEGTTISLFVPFVDEQPSENGEADKNVTISGSGKKILVLEDEENVRMVAKALLIKVGFDVVEAETAAEALRVFYTQGPFDLVLSDIELKGGMKGPEFVELIRKDFPDMKVVFMSGFSKDPVFLNKGSKLPANTAFLTKPFRRGDLLDKVVQLMDGNIQIG